LGIHWRIIAHASEHDDVSKTGTRDDTFLWDAPYLQWMNGVFKVLKDGKQSDFVWSFTYLELWREFSAVVKLLGIDLVPYQLRHSGASWEFLQGQRSLEGVQKRGVWKSKASVARYEKSGRMTREYDKLRPALRMYLENISASLERHIVYRKIVPPIP